MLRAARATSTALNDCSTGRRSRCCRPGYSHAPPPAPPSLQVLDRHGFFVDVDDLEEDRPSHRHLAHWDAFVIFANSAGAGDALYLHVWKSELVTSATL